MKLLSEIKYSDSVTQPFAVDGTDLIFQVVMYERNKPPIGVVVKFEIHYEDGTVWEHSNRIFNEFNGKRGGIESIHEIGKRIREILKEGAN